MRWNSPQSFKTKWTCFLKLLCELLNKFLSHRFVPRQILGEQIRPIFKINCASKTNSSKYRPVMNSSRILNYFESCLKPFLSKNLNLDWPQFGFRNNTSCSSVLSILKETVRPVFIQPVFVHSFSSNPFRPILLG